MLYLALQRLVSYRFVCMSLHRGCLPWQKLTQEIVKLTRACRETVAGLLFVFVDHGAGIRSATYLCLDCAKNVDKNWNITASFIIHINFDHACVGGTLSRNLNGLANFFYGFCWTQMNLLGNAVVDANWQTFIFQLDTLSYSSPSQPLTLTNDDLCLALTSFGASALAGLRFVQYSGAPVKDMSQVAELEQHILYE